MKLIKRIAAVIISGAAALSCYTFSSAAEEDIDGDADVIDTELSLIHISEPTRP